MNNQNVDLYDFQNDIEILKEKYLNELNSSICKFESKNLIETQKYSQLHICDCMSHSLGGRTPTWFLTGRAG